MHTIRKRKRPEKSVHHIQATDHSDIFLIHRTKQPVLTVRYNAETQSGEIISISDQVGDETKTSLLKKALWYAKRGVFELNQH